MIEDTLVSYETSKLLKENGFREKCLYFVNPDSEFGKKIQLSCDGIKCCYNNCGNMVDCPSVDMVMQWFREKHKLYINVTWVYDAIGQTFCKYSILIKDKQKTHESKDWYAGYGNCAEAAFKYCIVHKLLTKEE